MIDQLKGILYLLTHPSEMTAEVRIFLFFVGLYMFGCFIGGFGLSLIASLFEKYKK